MGILREVLAGICKTRGKGIYAVDSDDKSPEWLVVSYKDNFDYLWLGKGLWEWMESGRQRNILLVWDGMPEPDGSGVNVLDHITPVDWAMVLSHRLLQRSKKDTSKNIPELRILICDISQQNHASAFSVRMLPAICHGMPWLRVYRPIESDKRLGRDFDVLVDDIKQFDPNKFPSLKDAQSDLVESLVHAWIGSVAESGSHHDVSNLLGPLVLSIGFNNSSLRKGLLEGNPARIALLQKIMWSGMGGGGGNSQGKWFDFAQDAAKIAHERRVKIILVDDQANQGWLDIVSAAVGAVRPDASQASGSEIKSFAKSDVVDVFASTSYHAIKSRLEQVGISDEEGSNINGDQRFRFSLTGDGAEILLLDLRLFFNEQEEIQYFKWALGVARNLKRANAVTFPGMDCSELERWISEAEKSKSTDWRKTTEYLELLTLLPRILASIDMSLPIVIFSSTGQRQVAELLKSYGNLITVFEKPRFFGYVSADIARETQTKFSSALAKAVKMFYARKACQDLINVSKLSTKPIEGGKHNHVEIYIDEDHPDDNDQSKIYVGGCVAIYAGGSKDEALEKSEKFDAVLVTAGARYFDGLSVGNNSLRIKAKKSSMNKELESAMQDTSAPIFLGVARLCRERQLDNEGVVGDMTADNHFRRTLSVLLEVFLCEVLSRLFHNGCSKDNTSTSIFVGTRVKFYNERKRAAFEEAKSRFGLSGFPVQENGNVSYRLTSMDRGGVFPIIADLNEFRHPRTEIERAIGVTLCYNSPLKKRTYPLHFICRNCKEVVSYTTNDLRTTATTDVESSELPQNIAKVVLLNSEKGFCFIQPLGAEKVFCYPNDWKDFKLARTNGWVTYDKVISTPKGQRAKGVQPVDEDTLNTIKSATLKASLSNAPICQCGNPDFVPDYRALHYLADEALDKFPSKEGSPYQGMLEIIFDDQLDSNLESLVEAGRELDNGDTVSALIKASHALDNDEVIGGAGSYILARFPDVLERISNQDYWRMAQQL